MVDDTLTGLTPITAEQVEVDLCADGSISVTLDGVQRFVLAAPQQLVAKINGQNQAWVGRKTNPHGLGRWQTSIFGPVT